MDRKLKNWELALMFGILAAFAVGGWLGQEQRALADSVIRFHVIANSDSEEDQALKLAVRDQVLAKAEEIYPQDATLPEARAALEAHLEDLALAGQEVVDREGYEYNVTAQLTECWFPTKEYEGFALPAGQNWWCVAFPPLCLGAASETVDEATQAGYFTQGQAALVTEENEGYVLKFKSMELLGQLQGIFS